MEKTIELTFTESKLTKEPFSKHENGKVCILDFHSSKRHSVKPGETWLCSEIQEDERKIIVNPLNLLITKEQNKMIFDLKLKELKEKFQK